MKKVLKTISINLIIMILLVALVEAVFGGWLNKKNNLDNLFIVRDQVFELELNDLYPYHKSSIIVTKDKFGFRGGGDVLNNPENIDILCIGGSTTHETWVEDGHTWADILQKELTNNGLSLKVANAGIDGQSTFGHIKNFELWFPQVPDLRPQYVFFYIGINDFHRLEEKAGSDGIERKGWLARVKGKIKDNSAIYRIYRATVGVTIAEREQLTHSKVDFKRFLYGTESLLDERSRNDFLADKREAYRARLELLVKYAQELGAIPVFITQPSRRFKFEDSRLVGVLDTLNIRGLSLDLNGVDYYFCLQKMNKVIKAVAKEHNLLVIEQTDLSNFSNEDFYDFTHTSPSGSEKVGLYIASSFIEFLNNKSTESSAF